MTEKPAGDLGSWLAERCRKEGLSLRQAASNLSHATIADIIKGASPSPETIKRLAEAFGGDHHQRLVLEDKLLTLAGYRSQRPESSLSEPLARLLDKLIEFSESQLTIMTHFAELLAKMESQSPFHVRVHQGSGQSAENQGGRAILLFRKFRV